MHTNLRRVFLFTVLFVSLCLRRESPDVVRHTCSRLMHQADEAMTPRCDRLLAPGHHRGGKCRSGPWLSSMHLERDCYEGQMGARIQVALLTCRPVDLRQMALERRPCRWIGLQLRQKPICFPPKAAPRLLYQFEITPALSASLPSKKMIAQYTENCHRSRTLSYNSHQRRDEAFFSCLQGYNMDIDVFHKRQTSNRPASDASAVHLVFETKP